MIAMSDGNMAAAITLIGGAVVVLNGLGLAWIGYLQNKTKLQVHEVKTNVEANTVKTEETNVRVEALTEAVNGPLSAALALVLEYARKEYSEHATEENRQKLITAEEKVRSHEEGKKK